MEREIASLQSSQPRAGGPIWSGLVAAAIAAAVTGIYIVVVTRQGVASNDRSRIVFFATAFALSSLATAVGSVQQSPISSVALLGAASAALFFLGAVGIFSIGTPLLLAAILVTRATVVAARRRPSTGLRFAAVGAIAAFASLTLSLRVAL